MKKLVMYSDQIENRTKEVDDWVLKLIDKENPKVGYIPSCSDLTRKYFNQKVEHYESMGINDLLYFDLDEEYDETKINELLSCDAIHLSGGNTFYFLQLLKRRNFLDIIRNYVFEGGVLIGISAGSIMMSETIDAAIFGDEDNVRDENKEALGLVDFEFMPHWERDQEYLQDLLDYSRKSNKVIYACNDGDGIIINGDKIEFIGDVQKIYDGKISRI